MEFQDLQKLFQILCGEEMHLLDRYAIIYQQMRLIREQMTNLKNMLNRVDNDFKE